MKYLITIVCFLAVLSLVTIFIISPAPSPEKGSVVVKVNDNSITSSMLAESEKNRPSHHENRKEFLKSVVVEQLLIQEAKRQKIDQEPQFREAIKNHYEQSLVKLLLERKNQMLDATVSEGEIDQFLAYFGKTVTFTLAPGAGDQASPEIAWDAGSTETERFDALSTTLQPLLVGLQPGDTTTFFDTGNEWFAVRLENVTGNTAENLRNIPREMVRSIIATHKREQKLYGWINTLVSDADISIHEDIK